MTSTSRTRTGISASAQPVASRNSVLAWFASRGWAAFDFQRETWDAIAAGESGLVHAPTGTGKTYAVWMGALLEAPPAESKASPPLRILWLTPLRALASDTEAALMAPIRDLDLGWTVETRTSDTGTRTRNRQRTRLPTTLITTPESLSLLLSRPDARERFEHLSLVVVDEWHELMASKRGVQTELALARLRSWCPALRTWGLSATIGNLDVAMETLLGVQDDGSPRAGRLIRGFIPKSIEIDAIIPSRIERFPWAGQIGTGLVPEVIRIVESAASTLIFTNTRATAELWYQALLAARPDWAGTIALHHGSLDRKTREWVEGGLRRGSLRCVVCTSTLDLGVDFSPVDRVLQVGSPKGVARLIQRAGRSGHRPGEVSRVTCVPTNALELVDIAAARAALVEGVIESRLPVERPLDLLAQHVVTVALGGGFRPEELLHEVRTTRAYRDLIDAEWTWVLDFVRRGGQALGAYPEYAKVSIDSEGRYSVTNRQVALRHRLSIGTIVSEGSLNVRFLRGGRIGTVEESFIARLRPGDRFVLGGRALVFVRLRDMTAWVRLAPSFKGAVPHWSGVRVPISATLARAVRGQLAAAERGVYSSPEMVAVRPILELQAAWSSLPMEGRLVIERVRTRDGHHLFVYPVEGRLVHEGMAALFAYRLARRLPISFTLAANDYGFELLSSDPAPLEDAIAEGLVAPDNLLDDLTASLNAAELARRQFREIARVAGLIFQGYPGSNKSVRQVQASSGLLFDVFTQYDPGNLLLSQARREVLERQLEESRLGRAMTRLARGTVVVRDLERPTPFAFPLIVDRARVQLSSEKLADRIKRMQLPLERAAGRTFAASRTLRSSSA